MTKLGDYAKEVIRTEAEAIASMAERLDENFDRAANAILDCKGRVIVAGMGKSGLIGKKIAATLNSTGISSFFLHPAEAMHGDLGLIQREDIMMLISKSGQFGEMEVLAATARRMGIKIISLCGTVESDLFRRSDIPLDCSVAKEACPNNLVPTSSSTAALVMGDALAVALLKARNFTPEDFATLHPGGFLGSRLLKRVSELHHAGEELPIVKQDATMQEMIIEMTGKRLGCVVTMDSDGKVVGIFTDGDLRRRAESHEEFYELIAKDVVINDPKQVSQDALLDAALATMEKHAITQVVTVDSKGRMVGIIHLHDILKSKLV